MSLKANPRRRKIQFETKMHFIQDFETPKNQYHNKSQ